MSSAILIDGQAVFDHAIQCSMKNADTLPYADVGERLRFIRERMELNQREIAERLGISAQRWNNWEKGKERIVLDYALVLDHDQGVPLDFIYVGRTRMLDKSTSDAWASRPREIDSRNPKSSPDASAV